MQLIDRKKFTAHEIRLVTINFRSFPSFAATDAQFGEFKHRKFR
jgi:hypothetical protein